MSPRFALLGETVRVSVTARDSDGDRLAYAYEPSAGGISSAGSTALWGLPQAVGDYRVEISVTDGRGGTARATGYATAAERYSAINGRVTGSISDLGGTQVQIYRGLGDFENGVCIYSTEAIASTPGIAVFHTPVLEGIYYVTAVRDENDDGILNAGDIRGYFGSPGPPDDVVVLSGLTSNVDIRVAISPGPVAGPIAQCPPGKSRDLSPQP